MTIVQPALAPPRIKTRTEPDGSLVLRSEIELEPSEASLGLLLRHWAREAPDRVFLAERGPDGEWIELTWGEAGRKANGVAQALLDRDLGPTRPLMILSGNGIDHALLTLGAFLAGVPVVPVSPAYSLMSQDFGKVKHIAALVKPGLVYAAAAGPFEGVLSAVDFGGAELVLAGGNGATHFSDLVETAPTMAVEDALRAVGPDSVAKILFTSGSTAMPKGVINTHGMLCANQQSLAQIWPFTRDTPPVLVDWLPWNHTFGGNHNFNLILKRGGTLYIDAGRPAPPLIPITVKNLTEIAPTIYFNVPAGYGALLPFLERDEALRAKFFERLDLIFYAAAALPQDLWTRLENVAREARGEPVMMTSSWGLTETSPLATAAHFPIDRAGVIGVPVPGVEIKLTPVEDKLEMRVKGPNVTPGYLGQPDLTAKAFDADGWYRTGDAGKLEDPEDANKGLVFDGRVVEDFKLMTGTFVSVGNLRVKALAAASPLLMDAVVCGEGRDYVGLLAWLNLGAAREIAGQPDGELEALVESERVHAFVRERMQAYNAEHPGSSTRVQRVVLLAEPPSLDANEITDKGYVNQRAALQRRHAFVDGLFAEKPTAEVIVCP
ncbi:feruloyl-CoA synthase [Solirubrobacter sp. CPCC 204708]|uniref:Feruloyl-CoA synthase n=1 Tax=Solirubrobacter deserti TaxID=2282478 RepID=A0ABT4RDB2_9ACTN|nr:feruloyl-CoA synthase [Solirubrobacter deserti]MBE2314525.1 feruloyl-CoA synthase [Solirubrobacter deserti]MDA0136529.1 feruloyl-CoA synthase [Solirubrobacter deserti]